MSTVRSDVPVAEYLAAKGALSSREAVLCTVAWFQDVAGRRVVWPIEVTAHYPRRHVPTLPRLRSTADIMRALVVGGLLERVERLPGDAPPVEQLPAVDRAGAPLGLRIRARRGRSGQAGYRLTVLGRRAVSALPDRERHAAVMRGVVSRVWIPRTDDWTPWRAPRPRRPGPPGSQDEAEEVGDAPD